MLRKRLAAFGQFVAPREPLAVLFVVMVFLIVNIGAGERLPIVWFDEVSYTDPAINLIHDGQFTSSAWGNQDREAFWTGNVPMHQAALYVWLKLWGISPLSVRSINYFFVGSAAILLWATVRRLEIVTIPTWRLAFVFLVLSGYGMCFAYRTGRPDGVTIFVAALAAYGFSLKHRLSKLLWLGCAAIAAPISGLHLISFICAGVVLMLAFTGLRHLLEISALVLGQVIGIWLLFILYNHYGVWHEFLAATIFKHSTVGDGGSFFNRFQNLHMQFGGFYRDPSFLLVLVSSILLSTAGFVRGEIKLRSPAIFCLLASMFIPAVLFVTGHYPIYYGWMGYTFACGGFCALLAKPPSGNWARVVNMFAVCSACLAVSLGLPFLTFVAARDWSDRNHNRVVHLVNRSVGNADVVYCAPDAYYAVKQRAELVFTAAYRLTPADKTSLTVLILPPTSRRELSSRFGGEWKESQEKIEPSSTPFVGGQSSILFRKYSLRVYIRDKETRPNAGTRNGRV